MKRVNIHSRKAKSLFFYLIDSGSVITELPKVTTTPAYCSENFEIAIESSESQSLNPDQIADIVRLDFSPNIIEIGTDDFATYANQEATLQL